MGKVVVSQFITVDGVVEDPGGSEKHERGGWAKEVAELKQKVEGDILVNGSVQLVQTLAELVDAKPAGETQILIYEPAPAKDV